MKIKHYRRIIKEKPLPLNQFSDQNAAIKPINHEEHQERHAELQASIFHSIPHQISISKASWMRKWKKNTLRSRETRERGVLTVN